MKRLLSLVLCIAMLCSAIPMTVAFGEESSNDVTEYQKRIKLLTDIGMFTDDIVGDYTPESILTRYDLAKLMRCFINGHNMVTEEVHYIDTKGLAEVNVLTALGIFNGNPDGYFEPYANATNFQAYVTVLRALGYSTYIQVRDMTMVQCATYASRLGMCANPSTEHWLTMSELVDIFYDSLEVPVLRADVYTDDEVQYSANSNANVLSEYFDMYAVEGSVTATEYTNILGNGELSKGEIAIDGVVYSVEMLHAEDYIARKVKAYIKKGGEARDTIIAFDENLEDVIEITKANSPSYSNFKLTYYTGKNNSEKTIKLPNSVVVVYNGRVAGSNYEAAFDLTEGTIRLYKNSFLGDGYSVAVIENFKTAVVKSRESDSKVVYTNRTNADDPLKKIVCDSDKEMVKIFDSNSGRTITYESLLPGSVLSVKQSLDTKITEIYLCQTYFQGTVEKTNNSGGTFKAAISGNEYTFAEDFEIPTSFVIGFYGRFYTNTFGNICGIESVSSDKKTLGYLYAIDNKEKAFETRVAVRIFDINGAHIEAELAETVRLDGNPIAKANILTATALMSGGELKRQLVEFRMNNKGEINYIDTAAPSSASREDATVDAEKANTLFEYAPMAERHWVEAQFTFDAKYPFSRGKTKVIIVPPTTANPDASKFRVVQFTGSDFMVGGKYKMAFYNKDATNPFVETAVYELAEVPAFWSFPSLLVVSEVINTLDELTGEVRPNITGYYMTRNSLDRNMVALSMQVADEVHMSDGVIKTSGDGNPIATYQDGAVVSCEEFTFGDAAYGTPAIIGEGDIIWYQTDVSGRIVRARVVYDYSENRTIWNVDGDAYEDYIGNYKYGDRQLTEMFTFGDVESVFRNTENTTYQSLITLNFKASGTTRTDVEQFSLLPSYFKAIVYDSGQRENKFYQGTLDDLVSMEQSDECSQLFVFRLTNAFYNMFVIYK